MSSTSAHDVQVDRGANEKKLHNVRMIKNLDTHQIHQKKTQYTGGCLMNARKTVT